jgi:hypothetical protein
VCAVQIASIEAPEGSGLTGARWIGKSFSCPKEMD